MSLPPIDLTAFSPAELQAIAIGELTRRAKIAAAKRGVPRDEATRQKISEGNRRATSDETRAKRSAAQLRPEVRARKSAAMKAAWDRRRTAPIVEAAEIAVDVSE